MWHILYLDMLGVLLLKLIFLLLYSRTYSNTPPPATRTTRFCRTPCGSLRTSCPASTRRRRRDASLWLSRRERWAFTPATHQPHNDHTPDTHRPHTDHTPTTHRQHCTGWLINRPDGKVKQQAESVVTASSLQLVFNVFQITIQNISMWFIQTVRHSIMTDGRLKLPMFQPAVSHYQNVFTNIF